MLKGSCNRCGNCCQLGPYRCSHLKGEVGGFTTCDVYDKRYTNMPIVMTSPSGARVDAYCMHGAGLEEELRLMELIDQGKCSYEY